MINLQTLTFHNFLVGEISVHCLLHDLGNLWKLKFYESVPFGLATLES